MWSGDYNKQYEKGITPFTDYLFQIKSEGTFLAFAIGLDDDVDSALANSGEQGADAVARFQGEKLPLGIVMVDEHCQTALV